MFLGWTNRQYVLESITLNNHTKYGHAPKHSPSKAFYGSIKKLKQKTANNFSNPNF